MSYAAISGDRQDTVIHHLVRFFRLSPRTIGGLFWETYDEWLAKDASRLSAALAFYTAFSLAPLLIVSVALAGMVFGAEAMRGHVVWQVRELVGSQGASAIEAVLVSTRQPATGIAATTVGFATLAIGASLVVAELRNSLNLIWDVDPPDGEKGLIVQIWDLVKRRLFAFMLVVGIGFVLLVSLLMNAVLTLAASHFPYALPLPAAVMQSGNFVASVAVSALVFAAIYRVLPDLTIPWCDVAIGAIVTALLFSVGKFLISLYLGKSSFGSAYGAAGSLPVLLEWVYYSAQKLNFGAVLTSVY